ncbi:MAG: hypothetical protein ACLP8S_32465 [Solirubrobacteraceae bacterium]
MAQDQTRQRPRAPRAGARTTLLTERDRLVLAFLAEQRLAVTPQVQQLLGVTPRVAQGCLRGLREVGYIEQQRIFDGYPACSRVSRTGLRAIGSNLPPARVDLACYQHDVGLGWLWLATRAGAFGELRELLSERTLRSHDARPDRSGRALGVGLGIVGPGGREQLHYPDLLLQSETGKRVALELELTGKGQARLARIMMGYAADGRIDAVHYLVPDRSLGERIAQAARTAGIAEVVSVQLLAGPPEGAPDHGRTVGRARWWARVPQATAARARAGASAGR